jgi:hypothetical protein
MKTPTVDPLPSKLLSSSRRGATNTASSRLPSSLAATEPVAATTSQDRIAELAYQLWERDGRPHGNDLHYWHTAEQQLRYGRQ